MHPKSLAWNAGIIFDYEIEVYNALNVLVGSFATDQNNVPIAFVLTNETAFDYASLFTGSFPDTVVVDETGLPDRTKVRLRIRDAAGWSPWLNAYVSPP